MKQIVLGTAGHIDHGKTTLIKALTGVDTDRLKEEKERGITIELGFASLPLPSGQLLGVVDVPGHEKFVKNMVAGATGIDLVAMIVAADEGVMPQTREHLEICSLLGIRHGLVVLTKTDLVDEEWLELVQDDLEGFVAGTFLEGRPMIPVSAASGRGLVALTAALDELCQEVPARSATSLFRLPVDRVFSMRGFGTVITGTLVSGRVAVGDPIVIYPSRIASKVRGIQVHNRSVTQASAGMRTAINFQGLERAAVTRGEVVSVPGGLTPSYMQDIHLTYLASNPRPIKSRTRVRFHSGTSEVLGNLVLLDREALEPGESAVAQLRLDAPVVLVRDDHYVLRSYSPVRTIGGGQILDPIPVKHKRFRADVIEGLNRLRDMPPDELIAHHARTRGALGVRFSDLKLMTNLPDKTLTARLQELLSKRHLVLLDREERIYLHNDTVETLKREALQRLDAYHRTFPLKPGISKEELRSRLGGKPSPKLFNLLLTQLSRGDHVAQSSDTLRLAGHKVSLAADQEELKTRIMAFYREGRLTPPYTKEIFKALNVAEGSGRDVLQLLVRDGSLIKVKEELFFDSTALMDLRRRLVDFLTAHGEIDTPTFKDMTGASRKYVIPLLEYFDTSQVTLRIGDIRKLRGGGR